MPRRNLPAAFYSLLRMPRTVAAIICLVALLAVPVAASASTPISAVVLNTRADRAALNAYQSYLQALIANRSTARTAESAYAANTSSTCKGALATIASMSSAPAGSSQALLSLGQEIGDDANVQFILSAADTPFQHLSQTLSALHWAGGSVINTVKRFVNAENAMLALQPSQLCADAYWVASKVSSPPITISPDTTSFIAAYQADSTLANTRLTSLLKLLDAYETPADRGVVTRINVLAKTVNTLSTNVVAQGTNALFAALGVPKAARTAQAA